MKTLREMLKISDDQRQVDWLKKQLTEGCLTTYLTEEMQKDPQFNQYLKQVSEGKIDV